MTQAAETPTVFLSYSADDRATAASLVDALKANGARVWWDQELQLGEQWATEIKRALKEADVVLVLVTPSSVESHWVTYEWSSALARTTTVIPVVSGGSFELLQGPLASLQAVEYRQGEPESLQALMRQLRDLKSSRQARSAPAAEVDVEKVVKLTVTELLARMRVDEQEARPSTHEEQDLVFVITAFAPDMEPVYQAVRQAAAACGLRAQRVKDVKGDYRITDQILKMIGRARLVVTDLTHERPNVYFELGYARGLGKTVVTIIRDGHKAHFDVQDWTYISYADSRPLEDALRERFQYETSLDG